MINIVFLFFLFLHSKMLSELAAWEPRTFEALALTAREKAAQGASFGYHEQTADNKVYYSNDETQQSNQQGQR